MQLQANYVDHMGSDLSVVNAARVSYGKKKERLDDGDIRLISYLARHRHTSPFGHAFASFHIVAPIFVARQLVKHKFLRWNEISRRYVDSEPEFYKPDVWRGKPEDSKQGSTGEARSQYFPSAYVEDVNAKAIEAYNNMLRHNVAPEQARMILPQNTMTEWYWSGSLDAFADMAKLRMKSDTQLETQYVASKIALTMSDLFPHSWKELMND